MEAPARAPDYPAWTACLFVVAVFSLSLPLTYFFAPEFRVLGLTMSTLQNLALLACTAPILVRGGLRSWHNPVILAASTILVISFTLSSRWPELTVVQSLRTFSALVMGAYIYELRLDRRTVRWLSRLLPWMAVFNIAVAGALYVIADWTTRGTFAGTLRLAGTSIPGHMAYLGLVGLLFSCLLSFRRLSWLWVAVVNYGVVVWSGSRTAILGATVLVFGWLVARAVSRVPGHTYWTREAVALVVSVPLWLLSYSPWLVARMTETVNPREQISFQLPRVFGEQVTSGDGDQETEETTGEGETEGAGLTVPTTGRLKAWNHYGQVAKENIWFGRGIGTGVVAGRGVLYSAYKVPHNEYLRLLVDGGVVGLALMLIGYGWQFARVLRGSPEMSVKIFVAVSALVLAFDAGFRNPLIAQNFIVPFWLFLGIAGGALPFRPRATAVHL